MKLIDKVKKVIGKENKNKKMDVSDYTKELLMKNQLQISMISKKIAG